VSNYSIRAFDEAQRRKFYPERKGPLGVACVQRDIIAACKHLSIAADCIWKDGANNTPRIESDYHVNSSTKSNPFQKELAAAGILLLQVSGSMGIDLVSLLKSEIEKLEMAVI